MIENLLRGLVGVAWFACCAGAFVNLMMRGRPRRAVLAVCVMCVATILFAVALFAMDGKFDGLVP